MLRRKLYDYDFMGGIVAVYLGNSSNVEEALIKYFDSKESRGIWGFYGNDLSELKKKIDSPLDRYSWGIWKKNQIQYMQIASSC